MNKIKLLTCVTFVSLMSTSAIADGHGNHVYGPFPVTLKGYSGDKTNSVSYSGQVGRQLLHNSLKKALSKDASLETLQSYFNGSDGNLPILDPVSSDKFIVDHTNVNDISKTNLSGKA